VWSEIPIPSTKGIIARREWTIEVARGIPQLQQSGVADSHKKKRLDLASAWRDMVLVMNEPRFA
jgi:hypothetical protein